ncbi:TRAP transporter permease [Terasakiella sp. A23]|uniref:TRAP transporter permease n=1 Tax=Terasakiella sp. FCG-A23 TaxID=3080561 RepID=UPI0029555232|nr:TRAP transporter permease [Terasakiella sp. A23]MDV7338618.1 TRAP transporter permease [Terasakiella sp. A23]
MSSQTDTAPDLSEFQEDHGVRHMDQSPVGRLIFIIGIVLAGSHIYFNTIGTLPGLWVAAMHFGGFAFLCALIYPLHRTSADSPLTKPFLIIDILIGLAAIGCTIYLILNESALYDRGVKFETGDWIVSILAIAIALELVRRTAGWFIPTLILIALTYVFWWGKYLSGVFHFPGLSLETLLFRSFYGGEGMFGPIARISWSYVFMFIMFGAFLVKSGAGDFIIDLARCAAGRMIGGPGLVAVLGSGLMGSVSGSAVANTVSTGVITIPLMRKAGFPARFAAGVEAAASTGGQLMPPVMGAGAFIMATYTQVSYLEIIAYAAIPALLYFLSVGFFVRIEAKRSHTQDVEMETPPFIDVLKSGWHSLLPIAILVALLIYGFTPTYAAGLAILSVIGASWFSKTPMKIKEVLEALSQGAWNMTSTAILLVAIGLVVNVVGTTGVGNTFSLMITNWAGGSLLITLLLVAIASLVLGMGLPVTASYIVLATLSAPALYNLIADGHMINALMNGTLPEEAKAIFMLAAPDKLDMLNGPMLASDAYALLTLVPSDFKQTLLEQALSPELLTAALISAHMIIFWLSQDSNVTPPVCLTAFAAAAIAKTPPMKTGLTAWKVAKGLYIVPLLFAYTPLIGGTFEEVAILFVTSILGIYALIGFMEGYLEGPLNIVLRVGLLGVSWLLMWPHGNLIFQVVGSVAFVAVFIYSKKTQTKDA